MLRLSFFTCLMWLLTLNTHAQDCKHLFDSTPQLGEIYTTKSDRLFEITKGKTLKVVRFFYGSSIYNINITKDNPNLKIGLKLIDSKNLEVLWDNSDKGSTEEINISIDNSCRVVIEITSLAENEQQSDCIALTVRSYKNYGQKEKDSQDITTSPPTPDWQ